MEAPIHVVILGGTGFVGTRLVRRFTALSGFEVEAYGSRDCDLEKPESVDFLSRVLRPETCLLFCSTIARLRDDSLTAFHRNVAMAEHLAEVVSAQACRSLIFCSSIDVYGRPPSETPLTELSPVNPTGYYGLAKYVSERILQDKVSARVPLAVLRLPGIFSLDAHDDSVLGRIFDALRKNAPVELTGGGHQQRSYLHIDELDAVVREIFSRRWSGLLNVSLSPANSIRGAVDIMRNGLGSTSAISETAVTGSEFDICVDNAMLRSLFPEVAAKPLGQCLTDMGMAIRSLAVEK